MAGQKEGDGHMAADRQYLREIGVGAAGEDLAQDDAVARVAEQDGRQVANKGGQAPAPVAEGNIAVEPERNRHYDGVGQQVRGEITQWLACEKNDTESEHRVGYSDRQETGKHTPTVHYSGRRTIQH